MKPKSIIIVDGYTDEPGGLGVPPYIDVYPRYIAGSAWHARSDARVDYYTIDEIRLWSPQAILKRFSQYDAVAVIAGVVVPGKYIGGKPLEPLELQQIARLAKRAIPEPLLILVGPAARWGLGWEGGKPAYPPSVFARWGFDVLVRGDVEEYFHSLFMYGEERSDPRRLRPNYDLVDKVSRLGARIIRQHPNYARNLTVELETYRGCPRWVSGGCSFCVEPLRGRPIQRSPAGIVEEVRALYLYGARIFRLGRQADILVYTSPGVGVEEWPKPNVEGLGRVFQGIRNAAPGLEVLHIDNVNPGTIARHPREALDALKVIVEYHTPGDVAALGLETADPRVAKLNNLNTTPEEAMEAVRVINRVGRVRGYNGMPHLLPGINFILGLPGETVETYRLNRLFLERLLEEDLLVRRVNVRKLMPIPVTRAYRMKHGVRGRRLRHARSFTFYVRNVFEREMLRRMLPKGTRLRGLWVEACEGELCYARQPGSYPLTVVVKGVSPGCFLREVEVVGVRSGRSVEARIPDGLEGSGLCL